MAYVSSDREGQTICMTAEQADRYEADDETIISEIVADLKPGFYSIYASHDYLATNIQVLGSKASVTDALAMLLAGGVDLRNELCNIFAAYIDITDELAAEGFDSVDFDADDLAVAIRHEIEG